MRRKTSRETKAYAGTETEELLQPLLELESFCFLSNQHSFFSLILSLFKTGSTPRKTAFKRPENQPMAERRQKSFCNRCLSFLFSCGLSALCIWLALRVTRPTCSIEQFDAFALDKTANSSHANHTIYYDLKLKNRNFNKGIYYDALNITFYYQSNINSLIGNTRFDPFYQGHGKSTHRVGSINPRGVNWEKATSLNRNGSTGFRVVLATAIRYKMVLWTTKRHRLVVGTDLQVNDNGNLIKAKKNKGIKLISSGAPKIKGFVGFLCFLPFLLVIAWI